MINLLLYSHNTELHSLLTSALGSDFRLTVDSNRERVSYLSLNRKCDVVILDLESCPSNARFEFFDELQRVNVPVLTITGDESRQTTLELLQRGVHNCCRKPLEIPELRILLRRTHEYAVSKREAAEYWQRQSPASVCGNLVGSGPGSEAVYDMIRRVANLDAFVLITGESGTGKELIARAIHSLSHREANRFIAVSCGAIPDSLIEAELFGCEKGAFTGASARRAGYFEEAGAGTLLLDEIGEISPHTQIKLLRVLQQREFMRLGSSKAMPLEARVVFATNRNLKQMVAEGTFREDLYYRLNVIGIQSQPLRERRDEIPQLAEHFLAKYGHEYRKNIRQIETHALALLGEYNWPGNIRELENVIQRAIILSDDNSIRAANLPEDIQKNELKGLNDSLQWSSFEEQLNDYKVKLATNAVKECNGNKTLAAQSLKISRTFLHRLIREQSDDESPALKIA